MGTTWRATTLVAILTVIALRALAQPDKPATQAAANGFDLSGPWVGVFAIDLSTTYLADLDLKPDKHGTLSGEIHFTPVVVAARAAMAAPMEGTWRVVGTADRGTRTLTLVQKGWVKQPPNQQFSLLDMGAVYSAERDELAGQFVPAPTGIPGVRPPNDLPYFLFVRAGAAPDRAAAVANLKRIAEHTLPAQRARPTRGQAAPSAPTPPTEAALIEWAARYDKEYPGSLKKDRTEKIISQSLPLLNDAAFKPVFGETYDALDPAMLSATIERLNGRDPNAARGTVQRPNVEFMRDYKYLEYVIHPNGQRMISVAAMRTIDAWQAEAVARFRAAPVTAATFEEMAATQKIIKERTPYAWPSDRKQTEVAFEEIRNQVAGSSVTALADRAVAASTTASGMAGVKLLAAWESANASALSHADAASRAAAIERVNAQLDKLLTQVLEPYEARLGKLGTGVDAVSAGAQWHNDMVADFRFVAPRPPCQQIMNRFAARRTQDLAAAQPTLLLRIEKSASPADIDRVFADLSFPTDAKSPGYPDLLAAKDKRLKAIETERLMATFSQDEQKLMDRPGHIDLKRYKGAEPSPEECRLALLRAYAAGNGKMIDAHTARYQGVMYMSFIITATGEKVHVAAPTDDNKGYAVEFEALLQGKAPDDNLLNQIDPKGRGAQRGVDIVNVVNQLTGPQVVQGILRLEEDGWQFEGAHDAGAVHAIADNMLQKLMKTDQPKRRP
jgi:hypothetical protein